MSAEPLSDALRDLVACAVLAPSSHNTQPWLFRAAEHGVELLADRTRALPVNDPHDRELLISCGASLFNLRVGAASRGWATALSLLPRGDPDRLAVLERSPHEAGPDPELAALRPQVDRRRTCRQAFQSEAVEGSVRQALVDAAAAEGARLHRVDDERRSTLAALVAEGDEALWHDPRWRRELAAWMHPRRRGDGLSLPGLAVPVAQAVVRSFDLGHGQAARDAQVVQASPLLAVLATEADDERSHLLAGMALQRVLLTACAHGLQASYLNQPVQVASLRPRLRELVGAGGFPQLVLRLGRPQGPLPASPRRPLDEVIVDR